MSRSVGQALPDEVLVSPEQFLYNHERHQKHENLLVVVVREDH